MTDLKRSRLIVFTILLLASFLSSCSFIRIQNVATGDATVSVNVPDSGKAYVRNVPSGAIVDVFSSHSGGYSVTMIASEQYIDLLEGLRSDIETKLFTEGQTLTAEEVARLVDHLNQIDQLLEQTNMPWESCHGYVPEYDTAIVTISNDFATDTWILECGSGGGN
jgi:hypothetical protein